MHTKNLAKLLAPFLIVGCFNSESADTTEETKVAPVVEVEASEELESAKELSAVVDFLAEASLSINDYFSSTSADPHYGRSAGSQDPVSSGDLFQALGSPELPSSGQCYYFASSYNGEDYFLAVPSEDSIKTIGTNIGKTNAQEYKALLLEEQESCLNVEIEIPEYTVLSLIKEL